MQIAGMQKTTLVDFPGKVASIVFTRGCNMRCPYCHNKQIAFDFESGNQELMNTDDVLHVLDQRKHFIDGVVITGGEPTLQKGLLGFMKLIKEEFGLLVKLDTNGSKPDVVQQAINLKLVDYLAMDLKTSFKRYKEFLGVDGDLIYKTYSIIRDSGISYELRMTCYPDFVNSHIIDEVLPLLDPRDRIFIQKCNPVGNQEIDPASYDKNQLDLFGDMFKDGGLTSSVR